MSSSSVEIYWGNAKAEIDVFVNEVIEDIGSIRKCLSGEETEERRKTTTMSSDSAQSAAETKKEIPVVADKLTSADCYIREEAKKTNTNVFAEEIDGWDGDEEEEEELTWRMNPSKSMSDWTIEVVTTESGSTDIYHVHKSVLAVGPRRSHYFVNLFREQQHHQKETLQSYSCPIKETIDPAHSHRRSHSFQGDTASNFMNLVPTSPLSSGGMPSSRHTTTRLELEGLAAAAFPCLLDFMYDTQARIDLSTQNATALHVLAQRLEVKSLRSRVREFWMRDMRMENLTVYYEHARVFDDPLILRALEMYCAQHLFDVRGNCTIADILDQIDPHFLFNVINLASDEAQDKEAFSLRVSLIVAVYCNLHQKDLDESMFVRLTDARHLPAIETKAAKAFLEMQEIHCGGPNERYTSLTERCIDVLAENWDDACITETEERSGDTTPRNATVSLPRLVGQALEGFVSQSLANAKQRILRLEAEKEDTQRYNDELQHQLHEMQQKLDALASLQHGTSSASSVSAENVKNGDMYSREKADTSPRSVENSFPLTQPKSDLRPEEPVAESDYRYLQRVEPSKTSHVFPSRPNVPRVPR